MGRGPSIEARKNAVDAQRDAALHRVGDEDVLAALAGDEIQQRAGFDVLEVRAHALTRVDGLFFRGGLHRTARLHFDQAPTCSTFRRTAFAHALGFTTGTGLEHREAHRRRDQGAGQDEIKLAATGTCHCGISTGGKEGPRTTILSEQRALAGIRVIRQRPDPIRLCRQRGRQGQRGGCPDQTDPSTQAEQGQQPQQQGPAAGRCQQPGQWPGLQDSTGGAALNGHGQPPESAAHSRTD